MTAAPTTDEYRTLITRALGVALDADTDGPDLRRLFTPSSHRLALDPDVTVVRGARGTGKTYWAKALIDPELRAVAERSYMMPRLRRVRVTTGFTTGGGSDTPYPSKRKIARLLREVSGPEVFEFFWYSVVMMALGVPEIASIPDWADRIRWAEEHEDAYEDALRKADREARDSGETRVLLFDALDHLHADRATADRLVSALFQVALELRLTTGALRAKIFVRPDMYDSAPKRFPDASKLGANAADLEWSRENLYGLLFHRLGNDPSIEAKKFRAQYGEWRVEGEGRFIAPVDVIADETCQEKVFVSLAGPYMGTDRRKGHTFTWVPNHLQDGKGRVSPRTWLLALRSAAALTTERYATQPYPLHYEALRESLHEASRVRVEELKEDIGWAAAAIEQLDGGQVPMEPSHVRQYWVHGGLTEILRRMREDDDENSGPRDADDLFALIEELVELGVLTKRTSGALDLPDVYRLAFNIGRKGGVPRKS
ncbi:hypothetical protein G5C51_08060 [Streptomyces sp. A7024]|uniref:Uncharacterized protein n=1 Tax=Streptomyces coryli TaxID=1128680 RepID=A0A6G4TWG4_9ACTN|nr:hypothetical protein [Streptomyces coryli]NGN63860.1 hypothetical protein [Streptomyces coryli]